MGQARQERKVGERIQLLKKNLILTNAFNLLPKCGKSFLLLLNYGYFCVIYHDFLWTMEMQFMNMFYTKVTVNPHLTYVLLIKLYGYISDPNYSYVNFSKVKSFWNLSHLYRVSQKVFNRGNKKL